MIPKSDHIRTALFAGSFNPFTRGHADIVERGLKIFGRVIIGVGYNEHKPGGLDQATEIAESIAALYRDCPNVEVASFSGLTVEFCKKAGADVLLRGVRNTTDFEYEKNLADTNLAISGIETVLLPCRPELAFISSSMVRELQHNGFDTSAYLP